MPITKDSGIYYGIGHGGSDPGAVYGIWIEKNLALEIGMWAYKETLKYTSKAYISRTDDRDMSVNEKVKDCNSKLGAWDLAADIHLNSGGGDGVEIYYYAGSEYSKKFAQNVYEEILGIGQNGRGLKVKINPVTGENYFGFLRDTKPIAILIECAFIDSKDVEIIDSRADREAMGKAIARGYLKTVGLDLLPEVETPKSYYIRILPGTPFRNMTKEVAEKKLAEIIQSGIDAEIVEH